MQLANAAIKQNPSFKLNLIVILKGIDEKQSTAGAHARMTLASINF